MRGNDLQSQGAGVRDQGSGARLNTISQYPDSGFRPNGPIFGVQQRDFAWASGVALRGSPCLSIQYWRGGGEGDGEAIAVWQLLPCECAGELPHKSDALAAGLQCIN